MTKNYIIKRDLPFFGLTLEFTGSEVLVKSGQQVIDCHKVQGFRNGAQKMQSLEREMDWTCQAMA
jgi:hypothetical protein